MKRGTSQPLASVLLLVTLAGCGVEEPIHPVTTGTTSTTTTASVPPPPEAQPGCNPVLGDDCLTPFPSTFFEAKDATTATGVRIALTEKLLPKIPGKPLSVDRYNAKDGFSPATPFFVYFEAGVGPAQLPKLDEIDKSMDPGAVVQILDYETGARVPAFAELDANAIGGSRQSLIVRPMTRLRPGARYVIALRGLKDTAGNALDPAPFRALRDGTTLSESLKPVAARYEEIFTMLEKAGVPRAGLTLAWDVITASDATATSHLVAMRDEALSLVEQDKVTYSAAVTDTPNDANVLRKVVYTVQGPSYLEDDSGKSMLHTGPDGKPALRGYGPMPVVVKIPQCAKNATGPLPVIVFGHGLFGNAEDTLGNPLLEQFGNQLCVVFVGTDWIGLSSQDPATLAGALTQDLNQVYLVTDRLQQAHVNAQVMTRLFQRKLKDDPALAVNGKAVTDALDLAYFGISDGGIQGATFMALSPDIQRGALNVPGCEWSLMIQRSVDFDQLKPLLTLAIPDALDTQVVLGLMQSEWDYADPATFAPHLLHDPLPGSTVKQILVQESIGDAQVPNIATRVLARTIGLSGLDLIHPIYGVPTAQAPVGSAYTQWDAQKMPRPPETNTALSDDNGAHDSVYKYGPAQLQLTEFLKKGGQVQSTCGGSCVF
jgi:hypothetical protein